MVSVLSGDMHLQCTPQGETLSAEVAKLLNLFYVVTFNVLFNVNLPVNFATGETRPSAIASLNFSH